MRSSLVLAPTLFACGLTGSSLSTARAVHIVSGNEFNCALTDAGSVRCWGWGGDDDPASYAFMGDESQNRVNAPVDVGGFVGATQIATSYQHLCVVTATKEVACWGDNASGQLGDGTTKPTRGPGASVPGLSDVKRVAVGFDHTCALLESGDVKCWGSNADGQLGHPPMGSMQSSSTPVDIPFIHGATDLFAMFSSTCAIVAGKASCWGQFTTVIDLQQPAIIPLDNVTSVVEVGVLNACAIAGGAAYCWGDPNHGAIGNGTDFGDDMVETPAHVTGLDSGTTAMTSTVAVNGGRVMSWGKLYHGDGEQIGVETTPVAAQDISDAVDVSVSEETTCAATATGSVYCWGNNAHGGMGIDVDDGGSFVEHLTPEKVDSFE